MGIFRAIVEPLTGAVLDLWHNLALGGSVGGEFVGDDPLRRTSLLAQEPHQQPPRSLCVPMDLHDFVEDVSVLIDGAPEITSLAIDGDYDLIEMPYVMAARRLSFQAEGVIDAKFNGPASDCFVGYDNASLEQHFLNETQAQGKANIEPDGMCDDLGRKSVTLVTDGTNDHAPVNITRTHPIELTRYRRFGGPRRRIEL